MNYRRGEDQHAAAAKTISDLHEIIEKLKDQLAELKKEKADVHTPVVRSRPSRTTEG